MSILFTFPGQGAQQPGMLHALPDHAAVRATLDEAGAALKCDPLTLDSSAALQSTVAVQLALLVAGVAMARVLSAEAGEPDAVAGLSIGAYPAAVIAGALDFADAVRLVALRGHLMENAYPSGFGMAAITGLDAHRLQTLIDSVHSAATPVYLANLNAESQMVISGSADAMRDVMARALAAGARKTTRLAVSVPSHCALLDIPAQSMREAMASVTLRRPRLSYLSASLARALFDPEKIAADLAGNMACQVHWHDTARLAYERGARLALEMPPGNVLSNLLRPVFCPAPAIACSGTRLDTLSILMQRERDAR
ncbi:malonate decarboxylase subunit epsilon [Paludibacterium yongneupense]|uniref:malonate decarboxylase subunit epsilon n=1 Tax=Paludibacterium yongneupense TaxID=400061 RepID=UPI0003FF37B3|nr:malonate decarboxylase subunit epsilon [Paludibacterium yongneupense]